MRGLLFWDRPQIKSLLAGHSFYTDLQHWWDQLPAVYHWPLQLNGPGMCCKQPNYRRLTECALDNVIKKFNITKGSYPRVETRPLNKWEKQFLPLVFIRISHSGTMPILRYQYITDDRFPIDTYSSISCPSMSWTPLSDLAMSLALLSTWTQSTLIFCKYFNKDMRDSSHCSDRCWHMVQVVIPMNAWTHLLKVYDVDSPCKIKLTVNVYFKHSVTAVTKKNI